MTWSAVSVHVFAQSERVLSDSMGLASRLSVLRVVSGVEFVYERV